MITVTTRPTIPGGIMMFADAGQALFHDGQPGEQVFELREGIVRGVCISADGNRQIAAFFFAGDQIGLPVAKCYRYTAEAVTDLSYISHSRSQWHEQLSRNYRDDHSLPPSIWAEQDPIFQRGIIVGRNGALVRLCAFLVATFERLSEVGEARSFPFSQVDLADYLASTPETICRSFRQLRESGVIATPARERLIVCDWKRLQALASGCSAIGPTKTILPVATPL